jgi:predicted molibdopterin-dependent oxidoreductase YjgC
VDGSSRGLFCAMGACQECVVEVDGSLMEACRTPVRDGMVVTQTE